MWWDAEEPLGSGNYKEGRGGARPCPAVREKKHKWSATELHTGVNWALISASAPLETKKVSYFWKARPLSARLSSNAATYATSCECGAVVFLIHRKAGDCNFGRKREEMEKKAHSILWQNMLEIHLTSRRSLRWRWLLRTSPWKSSQTNLKFVSAL